jgi:hypothetical protein
MKLVAKYLIKIFFFVTALSCAATAQVAQHGTYFVAGFSPDYAVVAIDSREMSGGVVNDQYCKIQPLSRNAFFFARGVTSAVDNNTHSKIFDARDLAHSIYVQFGVGTVKFAQLAESWAILMKQIYETKPAEYARSAVHNIMSDGFFVGLDESGAIAFDGQKIIYQLAYPQFVNTPEPRPAAPTDPAVAPTYAAGFFEIIGEFANGGETDRAKEVIAKLGVLPPGPDAVAARYSAYVGAVRDWTKELGVGGEIAAIILERGQNWRWFHRPDFCPEN